VWREYLGDARLHGGVVCHVGRHVVDFLLAGAHQCAAGATVGAAVVVGIPAGMPTRGGGAYLVCGGAELGDIGDGVLELRLCARHDRHVASTLGEFLSEGEPDAAGAGGHA